MSSNPSKIIEWDGINKTRTRLLKMWEVVKHVRNEGDSFGRSSSWKPTCLTFAGSSAKFERLLVSGGITSADKITTIQTYQKLGQHHNGRDLLNGLIKTQRKYLNGMYIWPHNFQSFTECYNLNGCTTPSDNKQAGWNTPLYKGYMKRITGSKTGKFCILDLDFCGIFNKRNAYSVVNLFSKKLLDDSGVMFINHQKGRDVRGGKLFDILHGYLRECPLIDFGSIPNIHEEGGGWPTYVARYVLIPLFYICKAAENGYALELAHLVEYRDSHKSSGGAVNMLQFYFRWYRYDFLEEPDYAVRRNLEEVINEEYKYYQWIS